ncbi:MAG: magnesium transporter CorA family protein [Phyllobacterium sp.]
MISVYTIQNDQLVLSTVSPTDALPAGTVWIDLLKPAREEDSAVEAWTGISIPTREDMVEIEESSRFYAEGGAQYLTAPILYATDTEAAGIGPVTFILANGLLVTVRYTEPKTIALYISRAMKAGSGLVGSKCTGMNIMLGIIESATDRLADFLEGVSAEIDQTSRGIFRRSTKDRPMTTQDFRRSLNRIGGQGEFLSKVRESLAGIGRALVYLTAMQNEQAPGKEKRAWIKSLERDTQSLEAYVDFLSNKITFLLDTIIGMISIEQNAIIKIFSVAAVAFMPPTLVASIYGMNFTFMPELATKWGYPLALGAMVLSAIIPLLYFRKKGWF